MLISDDLYLLECSSQCPEETRLTLDPFPTLVHTWRLTAQIRKPFKGRNLDLLIFVFPQHRPGTLEVPVSMC